MIPLPSLSLLPHPSLHQPRPPANPPQFAYRLRACGHLSLGIFTSHDPATATHDAPSTTSTSAAVYSGHPSRRAALLGLICATLSSSPTVTDAAMTLADAATHPAPAFGHDPAGRTLCLHSLAVLPAFQRRGLARTLLRAYLQRMRDARVADRVALIAHQALIPYYESFGFRSLGPSTAQFGGGGWWDMVLDFDDEEGEGMMAGDGARVGSELEVEV
nr:putative n-acetyltransferase c9.02c [Quercus suber]